MRGQGSGRAVAGQRGIELPDPDAPRRWWQTGAVPAQRPAPEPAGPVMCPCGLPVAAGHVERTGERWHSTPACRALAREAGRG